MKRRKENSACGGNGGGGGVKEEGKETVLSPQNPAKLSKMRRLFACDGKMPRCQE
jgi:hypothetical protein